MFKGTSTQESYDHCLNQGLCGKHSAEFNKDANSKINREFCRKAFLFIRTGILNPFLFNRPGKCEKIQILMQRANYFLYCHTEEHIPDDAYDSIYILDSVIVFTLCYLSKICCIGALFRSDIRSKSEDLEIKFIEKLLHSDTLQEADISSLNPFMLKHFTGYDTDLIKLCYISTLLFVRNNCIKINVKTAIQSIEKDILDSSSGALCKQQGEYARKSGKIKDEICIYSTGLKYKAPYSTDLFSWRGQSYMLLKKYKSAYFDFYTSVMLKPTCQTYSMVCTALSKQNLHKEMFDLACYVCSLCEVDGCKYCNKLLHHQNECGGEKTELLNGISKVLPPPDDKVKRKLPEHFDCFPELIEASDSADSESEESSHKENENIPDLVEASDSEDSLMDVETVNKEIKTVITTPTKSKKSCKGAKGRRKVAELVLAESKADECVDAEIIKSYLKEASEALLEDCGYKALQLFCGKLKNAIESPELYAFEESETVCIKYSYGLAYCQSGGYDDLEKCIMIFKEIIEKHESVTFPAAYYALGLAYRKLNRFKDALVYLKTVKNILDKGIQFKVYPWPALTSVINETKSKVLTGLVEDLIKECENPPNPAALCRHPECTFQPPIYYSDPDFKGYISITCSEQCCLQYHLQCWKSMKMEKSLNEKDFLDQVCFTPDCDGIFIKVQSIDKKGDVSKEFLSNMKKELKTKWAKWDKKNDSKEKRKKKFDSCRSELQENESDKVISRKNSDVTEGSVSSVESSVSVNPNTKDILIKENNPQTPVVLQEISPPVIPGNESEANSNVLQSSIQSLPEISHKQLIHEKESESYTIKQLHSNSGADEAIKKNIFSYMSDFLQLNGPLKFNDPRLIREMSSFPEDALAMIAASKGIGEFLKQDLRFAFVGDTYICVIADLGKAYKMNSSSSLSSLDTSENVDYPPYFDGCGDASLKNFGLNPNAVEYMPFATSPFDCKNEIKNFRINCPDSKVKMTPENKEVLSMSTAEVSKNQNFSRACVSEEKSSKLNSFENKDINRSNPILSVDCSSNPLQFNGDAKRKLFEEFIPRQNTYALDKQISVSDSVIKTKGTFDAVRDSVPSLNEKELGVKLLEMLNLYFSEGMKSSRQSIDSCIEPYVIKKAEDITTAQKSDSMEIKLELEEARSTIDELRTENDVLAEQKSLLQTQLDSIKQQKQDLFTEYSVLRIKLADVSEEFEHLKKESSSKEDQLQSGRKFLLESLTDSHETIDNLKKEIDMLKSEKKSMKKSIDDLKSSLQSSEDKLKNAVSNEEKKHTIQLQNLQEENSALRVKLQQSDLRILHIKKTEYLKKIEEKSFEASKSQKGLIDGLSMMSGNLNPVLQGNMKRLASQLSTYIDELTAIKLDFMFNMNDQIDRVKNGASLMDLKEFVIKDLPDIPCFENLIPASSPSVNQFMMGSNPMPYNVGFNTGVAPPGLSGPHPIAPIIPPVTISPTAAFACPVTPLSTAPGMPSTIEVHKVNKTEEKHEPLDILKLSPDMQESYKTGMASFNSFASAPSFNSVHSSNGAVSKNSGFNPPSSSLSNSQAKIPPSPAKSPVSASIPSSRASSVEVLDSRDDKGFGGLDSIPKSSAAPQEKKPVASSKNNYEKLLNKLREQFPSYSQEELISYVKEFRMQRQGKLSGLPIDTIISHIGAIINARKTEKKVSESKIQAKANKTLVNKKLVSDPKPKEEPPIVKKKTAWNIDSDSQKQWSGNCDECCVICYEDMTNCSYQVACGHMFHESCIKAWLKNKSDCPICRVLLLLPEDYPSLN